MASNYAIAHRHNNNVVVAKYWSMNPDKYKEMTLIEASSLYDEWLHHSIEHIYHGNQMVAREIRITKSFIQWLESEI